MSVGRASPSSCPPTDERSGIVPVTLVNSRDTFPTKRQATHAEYSGLVLFRNTFDGELPAVEYPKISVSFCRLLGVSDSLMRRLVLLGVERHVLRAWMWMGVPVRKTSR